MMLESNSKNSKCYWSHIDTPIQLFINVDKDGTLEGK